MSDYILPFSYQYHLLPEEIIEEIILNLSSKSLIRFKSVCKQWCSLISCSQFVAKHLVPSHSHDDVNLLLVKRRDETTYDHVFCFLSDPELPNPPIPQTQLLPYPELPPTKPPRIVISGPCNGLVCIFDTHSHYIVLWRPVDGETKVVPNSNVPDPPGLAPWCPLLGFGYDIHTDDCKVIRISCLEDVQTGFSVYPNNKVEIYSFKTDSWKGTPSVALPAYAVLDQTLQAYVNGVSMWLASNYLDHSDFTCCDCILWFRMSDESFGITLLPAHTEIVRVASRFYPYSGSTCQFDPWWDTQLFALNDKTTALVWYNMLIRADDYLPVWVLLEFGVQDSWTPLFIIGPLTRMERPLLFWKNDQIIMENSDGELILCNPFTNDKKSHNISGVKKTLQIISIKAKYRSGHG